MSQEKKEQLLRILSKAHQLLKLGVMEVIQMLRLWAMMKGQWKKDLQEVLVAQDLILELIAKSQTNLMMITTQEVVLVTEV